MPKLPLPTIILGTLLIISLAVNLYTQYELLRERQSFNDKLAVAQNQIDQQRNDKNTIRDIWEKQAATNDKLVLGQVDLVERINFYLDVISRSIRFVNGQPQLLPAANETDIQSARNNLRAEIDELDKLTDLNAQEKRQATDMINALYLQAGEDQNNRANPEGIRK